MDPRTGEVKPLDSDHKKVIEESIEEFNKDRLRSLYIAYKDLTQDEYTNSERANDEGKLIDQHDLVFLGVFGIRDSLRDGVKEAVRRCHEAQVNVVMVTGDNIVTATAIAKECGILGLEVDLKHLGPNEIEQDPEAMNDNKRKKNYIEELLKTRPRAITGNSFYTCVGGLICEVCQKDTNLCKCPKTAAEAKEWANKYQEEPKPVKKDVIRNMDNFKLITSNLNVMARSQPLHKYALVLGLRSLKNVVAVTGDGTNDAPALSKSDVGFAMFAGTDIAKEASDIVIIDNNFSSIVTAIIYGRNIYDNIRKFLQFQLSVNFCACLIVFICACIGNETPLTPIQMLWVNLIMDSLGSLALATEPPYEELLQRAPTKRNESIINGRMWKHIIIQSLVQIVILLILYLMAPEFIKEDNLVRKAENYIIAYCYGKMPGGNEPEYIIYGTESKWSSDAKMVASEKSYCGSYESRQSLSVAYKEYSNVNGGTVHMSIIFNVFVIYTLFNQINCRMIDDSFNIFKRMNKSLLFPLITICEMGLQAVIVEVGRNIFHVANDGLTGVQWGICFGFSAITFVVSILCKLIPLEKLIDKLLVPKEKEEDKKKKSKQDTEDSTDNTSNEPKKLYDQALPVEARREREERDILKLSENSSVSVKKENEEL
jgi:Ca2+ transporting ATPase